MPHAIKYHLTRLMDAQLATLATAGVPGRIIRKLDSKRFLLLDGQVIITTVSLPFLPVIPFSHLNLKQQMLMVGHAHHPGISKLQESDITDIEPANEPYFICDINEGEKLLGKSAVDVSDYFLRTNLHPLTAAESLALALHTNVLQRHNLIAINSNYKIGDQVISLSLSQHQPALKHATTHFADRTYGIPFYQKRV